MTWNLCEIRNSNRIKIFIKELRTNNHLETRRDVLVSQFQIQYESKHIHIVKLTIKVFMYLFFSHNAFYIKEKVEIKYRSLKDKTK
jgi:hypothetical protein